MKTSKYILIAFMVFFFGIITILHIDSKVYEPEYNKVQAEKAERNTLSKKVFEALEDSKGNEGNYDKWNYFISSVKNYCSEEYINVDEINTWAWYVAEKYKIYKDEDAAFLAKKWCEIAYEKAPENHFLGDTYALLLFKLGYVEKAVKIQRIVVKQIEDYDPRFGIWYKRRLGRFERALDKEYEGDTKDLTIVIDNVKHAKNNKEKWNRLVTVASDEFENKRINIWFLKDICWLIVENHKRVSAIPLIEKAEEWCKKALSENPNSHVVNDCYAHVLFAQGRKELALKYGKITVDIAEESDPKYLKWCMPRLVKYKEAVKEMKKNQ